MHTQLSIIVPVYNVEEYIEDCIKSILEQDYADFELILIDDGSSDHTYELCQKYVLLDSRITLITQKNSGVSVARNVGISRASGEYIMFIDGDDMLQKNTLKQLMRILNDNDIISFPIYELTNDNPLKIRLMYSNETIPIDKFMGKNFKDKNLFIWGRIYRLKILKKYKLFFDTKLYYAEDMEWLTRLIPFIRKVSYTSIGGYIYRKNRVNSAMTNMYLGKNSGYFINAMDAYNKGFLNLKKIGDHAAADSYKMRIVHLRRFISWMLSNEHYTTEIISTTCNEFCKANMYYIKMCSDFKGCLFWGKNVLFSIKFILESRRKCKKNP